MVPACVKRVPPRRREPRRGALSLGNVRPLLSMLLHLLLGAAAVSAQSSSGGAANFEGRMIARIDFNPPEQPLPRDELDRLLPLHAGSALKQDDVHQALQKLFETGRFADVSIDAELAAGEPAN